MPEHEHWPQRPHSHEPLSDKPGVVHLLSLQVGSSEHCDGPPTRKSREDTATAHPGHRLSAQAGRNYLLSVRAATGRGFVTF